MAYAPSGGSAQPGVVIYAPHGEPPYYPSGTGGLTAEDVQSRPVYTTSNFDFPNRSKERCDCNPSVSTCTRLTVTITGIIGTIFLVIAVALLATKGIDSLSVFGTFWASIVLLIITAVMFGIAITGCVCWCANGCSC